MSLAKCLPVIFFYSYIFSTYEVNGFVDVHVHTVHMMHTAFPDFNTFIHAPYNLPSMQLIPNVLASSGQFISTRINSFLLSTNLDITDAEPILLEGFDELRKAAVPQNIDTFISSMNAIVEKILLSGSRNSIILISSIYFI